MSRPPSDGRPLRLDVGRGAPPRHGWSAPTASLPGRQADLWRSCGSVRRSRWPASR